MQTADGRGICSTGGYQSNTDYEEVHKENIANAKLIAVAPDMIELLIKINDAILNHNDEELWMMPNRINHILDRIK